MNRLSQAARKTNVRRRMVVQAIIGLLILALFVGAAWYLTSPQFHRYVRARVVARLEQSTGGRVDIASMQWNLSKLQIDVTGLTIHGLEPAGQIPLAHADRVHIRLKLTSVLQKEIGMRYLEIDRPAFNLIVYPDGSTNVPTPKAGQQSSIAPVQQLFQLSINQAVIRDGEVVVNNRRMPFDLTARDVQGRMSYAMLAKRYDGSLKLGHVATRYSDFLSAEAAANVDFSLSPNQAHITKSRITSGGSYLEASGWVRNFAHPEIDLEYRAHLNAEQAGRIARVPALRGGLIELIGKGNYAGSTYSSSGRVKIADLNYSVTGVRLPRMSGEGDFSVNSADLRITNLQAQVGNGAVRGSISVHNWNTPGQTGRTTLAARRGERRSRTQTGEVHLQIEHLPVTTVADAFSTRALPLSRLRLAGASNGVVDASWRGKPGNANLNVRLAITPPAAPVPGTLPVTGTILATADLAKQSAQVQELRLTTPSLIVNARGALGAVAENLHLALSVKDLRDIEPMLTALNQRQEALSGLEGQASFEGTVAGKLSDPRITGRVQVRNLVLPVGAAQQLTPTPATSSAASSTVASGMKGRRRVHIDSFSADAQYSRRGILIRNGVARHGQAQANIDFSAGLSDGQLTPAGPIAGHTYIRNADVADLQQFAGLNYPIAGTLNQTLQIAGTVGNPQASGHTQITNASIYGEPVQSLTADLAFANHEARVSNVNVLHNGARVIGSGAYNLNSSEFRFRVNGANFSLANIKRLQSDKVRVAGALNFNASGSGTLQAPVINANVLLQNLVMNGERVGDLSVDAVTHGDGLTLSARCNFPNAELVADGNIRLRDNYPADLRLAFSNLDIDPLLRMYVAGRITGHSSITGSITAQGPLKSPGLLKVVTDIPQASAEIEGIRIHNDGPIRVSLIDRVAHVDSLRLVAEDTQLSATGTANFAGQRELNLRADGRLNLKLIQALRPDVHSTGLVTFGVVIGGEMADPNVRGRLQISNGAVSVTDFPNGLSDIDGTLLFNQDRMQIQSLTTRTGGGELKLEGFATYGRTVGLNLSAQGKNIRLRYPQGVSSTVDTNLRLEGSLQNLNLSGDMTVTRFAVNPQFDLATYLASSNRPAEPPNMLSPLNNLHLDVHVSSTPELQVQTSLAKLAGDMDLQIRGTAVKPTVLGRINITEGQVSFNSNVYQLERGDVTFANPTRIDPVLDVQATTRVRDYEITLGFHGPVIGGRLATTYRSEPPLPTADIINLLAFGYTREETEMATTQTTPTVTESVSNAILGTAINQAVSNRVQRLFGVSRLKIAPELAGTGQPNPGAQVTIEQQMSKDITVTYITNVTQPSQQSVLLEYNINKNVSVLASRDQYGILSFDVRIRQRKR